MYRKLQDALDTSRCDLIMAFESQTVQNMHMV